MNFLQLLMISHHLENFLPIEFLGAKGQIGPSSSWHLGYKQTTIYFILYLGRLPEIFTVRHGVTLKTNFFVY